MHIINLSKVETVFPFFKKRDVILSRVLLKQQCRLSAQVEWGWEKWEKTHRQLYQINFQCAYPNYISQFWPDYHFNICVMMSSVSSLVTCEAIVVYFAPTSRHFPNIRETGCVGLAHMCRAAHGTGLLARVPADLSDADRRPSSALQAQLGIRAQSSTLQAWARHCKSSALPSGCLGLGCALCSVNGHMPVHVRASWGGGGLIFYILKGFKLSLEPQVWSKDWQRRKRKTFFGMGGWYIEAVTTNQRLVSTVCEVFMVASSTKETSTLCFVYIEFSMQSGLSSPANWDFFASFHFPIFCNYAGWSVSIVIVRDRCNCIAFF